MRPGYVALALAGLLLMLAGLALGAWVGQDRYGRWRPGAWRALVLAAGGLALMASGLRLAGPDDSGLWLPGWRAPRSAIGGAIEGVGSDAND
ncbi:MAG TPA: hypothetical protein DCZ72_11850 [Armatimonadetes bacterium]|nr:hypothetical protein [Armatimonadota bacterium]